MTPMSNPDLAITWTITEDSIKTMASSKCKSLYICFTFPALKTQNSICRLTDTLNHSRNDALRIEAARIIAYLAYGFEPTLAALLHHQANHVLLYSLADSTSPHTPLPSSSLALGSALVWTLRAVVAALADIAGPTQCGLAPAGSNICGLTEDVLEMVFCVSAHPVSTLTPVTASVCSRNPSTLVFPSFPCQHLNKHKRRRRRRSP